MKVILIENNCAMREKILKYFSDDDAIKIIVFSNSSEYGIDCIPKIFPDTVIIDVSDDDSILEYLESRGGIDPNINGILITNKKRCFSLLNACRLGFSTVMLQPLNLQILRNNLMKYYKVNNKSYLSSSFLDRQIRIILDSTGVSSHFDGYKYLVYAIMLCYRNEAMLEGVTKELYPYIAHHFSSSARSVERNMCRALEAAWKNKCGNNFYKRMGCHIKDESKKPTNREFISAVVEYIKLNHM